MSMIPQYDEGIRIFQGLEADVLDGAGTLCPGDIYLSKSEFCLASMHVVCCESGWDRDTTTEVWTKVCDNPWIDALGHIDRAAYPCDLEAVVRKAIRVGKLIELNNASMIKMRDAGRGNVIQLVHLCMQYGARVCVGSDAHYHTMVGDFSLIQQLLQEVNFPKELIVNRDLATFEAFLAEKQNRTQGRVSNAENYRTRLY